MTDEETIDPAWLDAESAQYELARDEWRRWAGSIAAHKANIIALKATIEEIKTEAILNGASEGTNEKARQAALDQFMTKDRSAENLRNELRTQTRFLDAAEADSESAEKALRLHMARIAFGTAFLHSQPVTVTGPESWPALQVAGFAISIEGAQPAQKEEGKKA